MRILRICGKLIGISQHAVMSEMSTIGQPAINRTARWLIGGCYPPHTADPEGEFWGYLKFFRFDGLSVFAAIQACFGSGKLKAGTRGGAYSACYNRRESR